MGIFDSPVKALEEFSALKLRQGTAREIPVRADWEWPEEESLVLEEDTALELGHPGLGSLSFLCWTEAKTEEPDRILLLGPDLGELKTRRAPLAQILVLHGRFQDEYDCYCELRETVYTTRLRGLMTRVLPSRQTIWSRATREALDQGLSLAHLGAALIKNLKQIEYVSAVQALFITESPAELSGLIQVGREAERIAGAMIKMNEEMSYDCDTCEFGDVCEKVLDLKKIREKLMERNSGR